MSGTELGCDGGALIFGTNGAKSLTTKLHDLKKTAKADLAEYEQLD